MVFCCFSAEALTEAEVEKASGKGGNASMKALLTVQGNRKYTKEGNFD